MLRLRCMKQRMLLYLRYKQHLPSSLDAIDPTRLESTGVGLGTVYQLRRYF